MGLSWRGAGTVVPAVVVVGGVLYGVTAWGYGIGTAARPETGLFPFIVAVGLVLSAATWLVTTALQRPVPHEHDPVREQLEFGPASHDPFLGEEAGPDDDDSLHWWRVGGVALAGTLVIPLSTWIGLVATAGVLVLTAGLVMRARPVAAVAVAAGFTLVAYLVFERWLSVPLPDGFVFTMGAIA